MAISVGHQDEVTSEPNVVPLCDVLLVLLIIFMVVTPLVSKKTAPCMLMKNRPLRKLYKLC